MKLNAEGMAKIARGVLCAVVALDTVNAGVLFWRNRMDAGIWCLTASVLMIAVLVLSMRIEELESFTLKLSRFMLEEHERIAKVLGSFSGLIKGLEEACDGKQSEAH